MSNATRILLALAIGLALGILIRSIDPAAAGGIAVIADPIGGLWLNGLTMTVIPLVVALLVIGIAQTADAARAGAIAGRALGWIVAMMTLSAVVGAIVLPALVALVPMPVEAAAALRAAITGARELPTVPPFSEFLRGIVPNNPVHAAAEMQVLPLIVFTGTFAFALTRLPEEPRLTLTRFFSAIADAMLVIIDWMLKLAPIGVFALAFVVGARSGGAAFQALLHYVVVLSLVGVTMMLVAYLVALAAARWPAGRFVRELAPVQALAISTQSSLACLPIMLKKSRALGVGAATADVTLPMAVALLRATGPAMNLSVALYVANWYGITLGPAQYAVAILAAVLTSMGAVSLPGQVSFVTSIAPICLTLGVPVEPLALLIAVETLPDIFRTLGNVTMDVAVTGAVARQTGTMSPDHRGEDRAVS